MCVVGISDCAYMYNNCTEKVIELLVTVLNFSEGDSFRHII